MNAPTLLSIQVSLPKHFGVEGASDPNNRPWSTGIFKEPVQGSIWLGETNLIGDGQADLTVHGGPEKAVLSYSAEHYPGWNQELAPLKMPYGAFGENFTISGQTEESVCIGDTYAIGEVCVQVSQPRLPCWKLARKWQLKDLPTRVLKTNRGGWYFRVLTEGYVKPNLVVKLVDRPFPQWTITRVMEIYLRRQDRDAAAELARCQLLEQNWRQIFYQYAASNSNFKP
ncbi:MAG: MOSC domain-containing protein [Nostoc sp. ChiQUE01a]|nr:MOSC domain-containing protein [Nostoc sp. ChiQUE01a]